MQIEMTIKGLMVDPITNMPIIILRDKGGQRVLPIWVGVFEANAIALQMENVQTPRPMTHDLLKNVIAELGATVSRVVITELREATYYAEIHLNTPGGATIVSSRPSDAVALALRTESPLYVDDELMEEEGRLIELADEDEEIDEVDCDADELAEQFRDFLDTVHPEDFQP